MNWNQPKIFLGVDLFRGHSKTILLYIRRVSVCQCENVKFEK